MAVSNAKSQGALFALAALIVLSSSGAGRAAAAAPRRQAATIVLDAQSADADLSNNNVVFRKVRITQGDMSISADQGQGTQQKTRLDFDDSLWNFRGNVKITVDSGVLTSDDAQINFTHQALSKAVVNGKPAAFEQRVVKTGRMAQGHAETIDYDAAKGIVRLSRNASLNDGQYEIHGESVKYNLAAQQIIAEAPEQNSQRVHIVITPPASKP